MEQISWNYTNLHNLVPRSLVDEAEGEVISPSASSTRDHKRSGYEIIMYSYFSSLSRCTTSLSKIIKFLMFLRLVYVMDW